MDELKWLKKQIEGIDNEIKSARKAKTNNGDQSVLIYNVWRTQITLRLRELTKGIANVKSS